MVPELYIINDYKTLVTYIEVEKIKAKKLAIAKLEKMDKKQFYGSLKTQKNLIFTTLYQVKTALKNRK